MRLLRIPLRAALLLLGVLVPLAGAWVASSLAMYLNGPVWAALGAGLLAFPIGPIGWEARQIRLRRQYGERRHDWVDRSLSVARHSISINLVLLVAVFALAPRTVFSAVSTRGDWVVEAAVRADRLRGALAELRARAAEEARTEDEAEDEGKDAPAPPEAPAEGPAELEEAEAAPSLAERAQAALLWVADRLSWLESFGEDNPYAEFDDSHTIDPGRPGWRTVRVDEPAPEPPPPPRPGRARADAGTARPRPDAGFERPRPDAGLRLPPPPPPPPPRPVPDAGVRVVQRPPDTGRRPSSADGVVLYPDGGVPTIVVDGSGGRTSPPSPREPPPPPPSRPELPPPTPPRTSGGAGALSIPVTGYYARWMLSPRLHPAVTRIPASEERAYADVARWLAREERDPFERVKAIHDYIADRIAYDASATLERLPASDPETVFARRIAVCSGYTRLFEAMYAAIGGRAVYISGQGRGVSNPVPGASHAWSAVEIAGAWYLMDITWNAGHLDGGRFVKKYKTDHLLPPPELFGLSHRPKDDRWQLVDEPLSSGEFQRQPLLWPRFFALGFGLVDPQRSQVTVYDRQTQIVVDNPRGYSLLAKYSLTAGGGATDCALDTGPASTATCRFSVPGSYWVKLYGSTNRSGLHQFVGRIEVNVR
jgi:hypothetical protein